MFYQSYQTQGLYPRATSTYGPLLAGGAPVILDPTPKLNPSEDPDKLILTTKLNLTPDQIQSYLSFQHPENTTLQLTPAGYIEIGQGYAMDFDPDTLQGRITPALATQDLTMMNKLFNDAAITYTGTDLHLMIESAETPADGRRYAKQLIEATSITVSVHRGVSPVRAGGFISPKGFALGGRTVAGTLIVTQFTSEVLMRFLQSIMLIDGSKDTFFSKVDQLPPFNITMLFTNEAGFASCRRLLGVKFVTEGVIYSIHDLLSEVSMSWMALDFTPLVPLTLTDMYQPIDPMDKRTRRERIPTDRMRQI